MDRTLSNETIDMVSLSVALAVAVVAAVTDSRKGKVHNWLAVPVVALGRGPSFVLSGPQGLTLRLFGIGVGLAVWSVQPSPY